MKQPPTNEPGERDGRKDFDFLIGSWKIRHRRLKERLKGCIEWEEFEGTSEVRSILDGLGNMDELTMNRASGRVQAVTVRLYNPATREWSIYWVASSSPWDAGRANGRQVRWFARQVFLAGSIRRQAYLQPLRLDREQPKCLPLGTSVFGRRWEDVGNQLDHGVHPAGIDAIFTL